LKRRAVKDQKPPTIDDELPTRASLLARLGQSDDDTSWREFFERYWRLIYQAALREGLSDADAQDVVQEVVLQVSRQIGGFRYDPQRSFKGWLLRTTHWKVMDVHRRRTRGGGRHAADPGEPVVCAEEASVPGELEARWDAEWESALMQAGLASLRREVRAEHFQVFDLLVLQGRPASVVATVLGVNLATVYVVKHRLGKMLKAEIERLREHPV
jgi:RNA polymerase sigma factor (sigma-70 family)